MPTATAEDAWPIRRVSEDAPRRDLSDASLRSDLALGGSPSECAERSPKNRSIDEQLRRHRAALEVREHERQDELLVERDGLHELRGQERVVRGSEREASGRPLSVHLCDVSAPPTGGACSVEGTVRGPI